MRASQRANDRQYLHDQSAPITSVSLESIALIYEHATQTRNVACQRRSFGYWQPQKEPTASCALYQLPGTAGAPPLVHRLLSKSCRITNAFFDYKRDESSLMMHSIISTFFFYSSTGLLIFLLKTHDFLKSITLAVSSQNGRQPGDYHFVRPHIA